MPFKVPKFTFDINVWTHGNAPPMPPRLTVKAQMRSRPVVFSAGSSTAIRILRLVCVAQRTDIRGVFQTTGSDLAEVPAGSGKLYDIGDVDDVARGFANEYRVGIMLPHGVTPTPLP